MVDPLLDLKKKIGEDIYNRDEFVNNYNTTKSEIKMATTEEDYSESDVRGFISSFREGLQLYLTTLNSKSALPKLKSSNVENPPQELIKISKLLFAHATKLGIVFKPKVSTNAAYKQLKETSSVFLLLISLIGQFTPEKYSLLFQTQLVESIKKLISSYILFLNEVEDIDFNKEIEESEKSDVKSEGRLVSVGMIWDNCKELENLVNGGKLALLNKRLKQSIGLIEDAIEEFGEWLEDPTIVDDEDPFGIESDFSGDDEDKDEEKPEIDPQALELAEIWNNKVKLIKLLISSLNKSLPNDDKKITGPEADDFNKQQNGLVEQIDDLFSTFFMNGSLYELKQITKNLEKQCLAIIEFVKKLSEGDEKKTRWLTAWQDKFIQ